MSSTRYYWADGAVESRAVRCRSHERLTALCGVPRLPRADVNVPGTLPGDASSGPSPRGDRDLLKTLLARAPLVPFVVLSLIAIAGGQGNFRVSYRVVRTTPTHTDVEGTVYNDSRADAADVSVTVEAVGPSGKVLARGVSYVASQIREGGSSTFTAKVPAVPGTATFRATVTSFKFMQSLQGP